MSYWSSLPSLGADYAAIYRVSFSKVGPGIMRITLTRANKRWELRSVEVGLETRVPGARESMLRIGRSFLKESQGLRDPADVERALTAMFGPQR